MFAEIRVSLSNRSFVWGDNERGGGCKLRILLCLMFLFQRWANGIICGNFGLIEVIDTLKFQKPQEGVLLLLM